MLDHVSIGVRNAAVSKPFYDGVLQPLGYACLSQSEGSLGYGSYTVVLWVNDAARPVPDDEQSGLHFCFTAKTRVGVDAFHAAGLIKTGGRDNGAPGLREDYGNDYYAAFLFYPDGYRLEAYCAQPA